MTLTTAHARLSLMACAVALLVLQLLDVGTTKLILHHAGAIEANPLARFLLVAGWLIVVKIALAAALLWRYRTRVPTLPLLLATVFTVGLYFAVVLGNALDLLAVAR